MTADTPIDSAQLSSLSTALDDLARRVTDLAEHYHGSPRDDVAADLYEVERHLHIATRRLRSVLDRTT
jgi:hypothetical protein